MSGVGAFYAAAENVISDTELFDCLLARLRNYPLCSW